MPELKNDFVYALHGFLGCGTDWSDTFKSGFLSTQIQCPSYFLDTDFENLNLETFVKNINNSLSQISCLKKIFIGYSLGGRIGLRLLEFYPDLFDHFVFISTHPGLQNEEDRVTRVRNDELWIQRLKNKPWDEFLYEWNQQSVLSQSTSHHRSLDNYKLNHLIQSLTDWSLGRQKDYSDLLHQNQSKIIWMVGSEDKKFVGIAEDLKQKKILLDYKRIFSGHRILFDNPKDLQSELQQALLREHRQQL